MIFILLRKIRSFHTRLNNYISTLLVYFSAIGNPSININKNCQFGRSVKLIATDGGSILIGQHTSLGDHVQIIVQGKLTIENNVFVGSGSIIVCKDNIYIGKDSLIAEYVVIRDQDHRIDSRPVRKSGFHATPIHIDQDVWIGCKATVLRGSTIGEGAVVAAHSLVRGEVPPFTLAAGTPAQIKKKLI